MFLHWRFSIEGLLEYTNDNKFNLLAGCYLMEKQSVSIYISGVDLYSRPDENEPIIRLNVASKKTSINMINKMYLKL